MRSRIDLKKHADPLFKLSLFMIVLSAWLADRWPNFTPLAALIGVSFIILEIVITFSRHDDVGAANESSNTTEVSDELEFISSSYSVDILPLLRFREKAKTVDEGNISRLWASTLWEGYVRNIKWPNRNAVVGEYKEQTFDYLKAALGETEQERLEMQVSEARRNNQIN